MPVKEIIIFTAGVCAGIAGTYLFLDKKYEKRMVEEIESVKATYGKIKKVTEDVKEVEEEKVMTNEKPSLEEVAAEAKKKYGEVLQKTNYATFAKSVAPSESPSVPYIMSIEEYAEGRPEYAKETLLYFDDGGELATESEELINASDTIGEKNLAAFANSNQEGFFVRDDSKSIDYEIVRVNNSYEIYTSQAPLIEEDD